MINLEKEIQKLLRSLHNLKGYEANIPSDLREGETAKAVRSLIQSAEEKVMFLMEQRNGRW